MNGWVIEDPGAASRTAGGLLTSIGLLLSGAGLMMLAMYRMWGGVTLTAVAAVLVGSLTTAIGWGCLRHAEDQRARLVVPRAATRPRVGAVRPSHIRPSVVPAGRRQRVELIPMAALASGRR